MKPNPRAADGTGAAHRADAEQPVIAPSQTCSMIITAVVPGSRALKMCGASPG